MLDAESYATINIGQDAEHALIMGAQSLQPVQGLTHGFYKYPARFSPCFARAAIKAFTEPGDWVLDNHVGGGTTLVEALALGRHSVGADISSLAEFVSNAKTMLLSDEELERLERWAAALPQALNLKKLSIYFAKYDELGYYKHLDHPSRWRLRKAIEQGLGAAIALGSPRLEAFGRCVVLRAAQWALDGRKTLPTFGEFRTNLVEIAGQMIDGARELKAAVGVERPEVHVLHREAAGLHEDAVMSRLPPPRLLLTSPPYPGVHVLYHRWQVDGRKEAPLPFMIANKLDGAGSSYYTMGDRKFPELRTYFENIRASMASAAEVADDQTVVIQMVAFSDPSWQLGLYLETMEVAGFTEAFLPSLRGRADGRLWRSVPNRRWYSQQRGTTAGSQEVVLMHRKRGTATRSLTPARQLHPRPATDLQGQVT
jgi:hypothetical protein